MMSRRVVRWSAGRCFLGRRFLWAGYGVAGLISVGATAASAQSGRQRVSYDVELSTTGNAIAKKDECSSAGGFDKLTGTLTGIEPAPAHEDNTYIGLLKRTTSFTFCSVASDPKTPDVARHCAATVVGSAEAWFELEVSGDARGSRLKALLDRPVKVDSSKVTGTCDPSEMAEWQRDYGTMSTAGSPDGQFLDFLAFPRSGLPMTFPPRTRKSGVTGPAEGDAVAWTIVVKARRP